MNKNFVKLILPLLMIMVSATVARADYAGAVTSLHPVAYWPLQETNRPPSNLGINSGTAGSTYNGYYLPGVTLGAQSALAGSTGTSASFTSGNGDAGTSAFLDVPYGPAVAITPPFTVEAWLNSGANNATYCALAGGDFNSPRSGWLIYNNAGVWNFRIYNQNGTTPALNISSSGITQGTWYHVVAICDANTNGQLYVNGTLAASGSGAGYIPDPDGDLTIGARSDSGFVFQGGIDEVAIYTTALSASDILAHYQNGINASRTQSYSSLIQADNPLFYYHLDEASPATTTATNYGSLGAAINGNYLPGTQPGTPGPIGIGFGATNYACSFVQVGGSGNGGYVDCTANAALNITNQMSVIAWFKGAPADNRFQSFLGKSDNSWRGDLDPNNAHWADGGGNPDATGSSSVNDGNWHFYAGIYDGTNNYVYIDGNLDGASGATPGFTGDPNRHVVLGGVGDYNSRNFLGSLSQVAVYTNALSAAQVTALYYDATNLAPEITQNPQSEAINLHGVGSFNVVASGYPVAFQWYQGTTKLSDVAGNITGSTTDTLNITNANAGNAGNYVVVVTNIYGAVTSTVASLTVYSNVLITADISPASAILYSGGHATFSITAGGASPITYQWYSNTVAVAGATNRSYLLPNVQAATSVYCVASNQFNAATSSVASVTIISPTASYPSTIIAAQPVGFWRLNEADNGSGNNGATSHDYWGGNNGVYTNTALQQPGYNPSDTSEFAALFGSLSFTNCLVFNIPNTVDFSAPSNSNSSFSIECWANGYTQTTDAGIVSKGTGGGGEQFNLDTGNDTVVGSSTVHQFRFFVRDASGGVYGVNSSVAPDSTWHHLAAVCDEANGYVALYIDGLLVGTNTIPPGSGILATGEGMKIGSRPAGSVSGANGNQFSGYIADVSVYNYALSAAQVLAHFDSADIPAKVVVQPTNTVAGQNGTATFSAIVEGTPPLTNQWYNAGTGLPIAGATNTTLVLANVQASDNGSSYYLTTSNAFGSAQSQSASLTVVSGMPQIYADVQSPFFAVLGGSGSDTVLAYGTEPLSYQWRFSGNNLSDGAGISGSHSNVLTIANAQAAEAGSYQVVISNGSGSVTSSVAQFIVGSSPVQFNVSGGGWQGNGNASISANALSLTEGSGGQFSSFFYNYPQYIGAFQASWTYQDVGGGGADGASFCLQNDPRGVNALGGGGGSLGVSGITPSAELEFNIYSPNGVGYAFLTQGATGAGGGVYLPTGKVAIDSGDPINVVLNYANGVLALSLTDNGTNFSTNIVANIPAAVGGSTAYVGFTGADGGVTSSQVITNFSFVSIAPQAIQLSSTNAVVTWPGAVLGFQLQQSTNLTTGAWINVTNADVIVNGQHQVIVPLGPKNAFYRLKL